MYLISQNRNSLSELPVIRRVSSDDKIKFQIYKIRKFDIVNKSGG